jgi:hypothetical protein
VRQVQQFGHGGLGGVGGEPPVSVAAVAARRVDHLQLLKVEFGNPLAASLPVSILQDWPGERRARRGIRPADR